ncbi:MAG: BNR repeat-containing protein [Opitutaceae bacterium]
MVTLRLWLALSALLVSPAGLARPSPDGERIDEAWAGHPVAFAFLAERGHLFIAYYDAERRMTIAGRPMESGTWTRIHPEGRPVPRRDHPSNAVGWDSHNSLHLALDREGCLHLSGNLHGDPLIYYRTRLPFDLSSLERLDRMTGDRESRTTYPLFFKNAAGDLLFRYRDGSSGNGSDYYNRYDPDTRSWSRLLGTPLHEGEGERSAYASAPLAGPDGFFHVLWVWRDTPDAATNHTLSYARSRDLVHWETSSGQPLTLPITYATSEVVDPASPGGGLINMCRELGFDADGRVLAVYHRYDESGRSQAYIARPTDSGRWDIHVLSDWTFRWAFSGGGAIPGEVGLGRPTAAPDGTVILDYATVSAGSGRWVIDSKTLRVVRHLPPAPSPIPAPLRAVRGDFPGLSVQSVTRHSPGRTWFLRWETLGRNRDRPHPVTPPPSELRLYELPDASDGNVGSGAAAPRP